MGDWRGCDKSTTVSVKVKDITAPSLKSAEFEDYKTVLLTFDEDVVASTDGIVIKTEKDGEEIKAADNAATVETVEDNAKTLKVSYKNALAAGKYTFTISGLSDKSENAVTAEKPATIEAEKKASILNKVAITTTSIPAARSAEFEVSNTKYDTGKKEFDGEIVLKAYDQYGKELDFTDDALKDAKITAVAGNGVPLSVGKGASSRKNFAGALAGTDTDGNTSGSSYDATKDTNLLANRARAITDGALAEKVYFDDANADTLTAGQTVTFSVTQTTDGVKRAVDVVGGPFTLVDYSASVKADKIKAIHVNATEGDTTTEQTALTNGKVYKLTADVLNQYGNTIDASDLANIKDITWDLESIGEDGVAELYKEQATTTKLGTKALTGNEVYVKALKSGTIKVTAYLANGEKCATAELKVSAPALDTLNVTTNTPATSYNNEWIAIHQITGSANAVLTPEMLKAEVIENKPTDTEAKPEAPEFKFAYAKNEDGTDDTSKIIASVKTTVAGTYKVAYYTGESYTDKNAVKANAQDITTSINPNVDSIKLEEVTGNQLPANGSVIKKIDFTNKYGEAVNSQMGVNANKASVAVYDTKNAAEASNDTTTGASSKVTAAFVDKDDAAGTANPIAGVKITCDTTATAGTYYVKVIAGTKTLIMEVPVVQSAKLKSAAFTTTQVTVINNDKLDEESAEDDLVYKDGSDYVYQIIPLKFVDSFNNEVTAATKTVTNYAPSAVTICGKDYNLAVTPNTADSDIKIKYLKNLSDNGEIAENAGNEELKYIAIGYQKSDETSLPSTNKVTLSLTDASAAPSTTVSTQALTLKIDKSRTITSISVEQEAEVALDDAKPTFKVSAKDQYGKSYALVAGDDSSTTAAGKLTGSIINDQGTAVTTEDVFKAAVGTGDDAGKLIYTLDTTKNGIDANKTYTVKFTTGTGDTLKTLDTKSIQVVDAFGIDSLEFASTASVTTASEDAGIYDLTKPLNGSVTTPGLTYTLKPVAKTSSGKEVKLADEAIKVSKVTIERPTADGKTTTITGDAVTTSTGYTVNDTTGIQVKATQDGSKIVDGDKLTISAYVAGNAVKSKEVTMTFSDKEAAIQKGSYFFTEEKAGKTISCEDNIVEVSKAASDAKAVTIYGKTQYGLDKTYGVKPVAVNANTAKDAEKLDASTTLINAATDGQIDLKVDASKVAVGDLIPLTVLIGDETYTLTVKVVK